MSKCSRTWNMEHGTHLQTLDVFVVENHVDSPLIDGWQISIPLRALLLGLVVDLEDHGDDHCCTRADRCPDVVVQNTDSHEHLVTRPVPDDLRRRIRR